MKPLVVYTGSQVWEGRPTIGPAPAKRMQHGPGLYFTTSLLTARRYGKGSRTVLRVEIDPRITWLEEAIVPLDVLLGWVEHQRGLKNKDAILTDLVERAGRGLPPGQARASALVYLLVNYGSLSGCRGPELAEFLVSLGIHASHVSASGDEEWVVLFDPSKVLGWRRAIDSDAWQLPSAKRSSR